MVDHTVFKNVEIFKGLDTKSSDVSRSREYSSDMRNAMYKLSGAICKRKGFSSKEIFTDTVKGMTTYKNVSTKTGVVNDELLVVTGNKIKVNKDLKTTLAVYLDKNIVDNGGLVAGLNKANVEFRIKFNKDNGELLVECDSVPIYRYIVKNTDTIRDISQRLAWGVNSKYNKELATRKTVRTVLSEELGTFSSNPLNYTQTDYQNDEVGWKCNSYQFGIHKEDADPKILDQVMDILQYEGINYLSEISTSQKSTNESLALNPLFRHYTPEYSGGSDEYIFNSFYMKTLVDQTEDYQKKFVGSYSYEVGYPYAMSYNFVPVLLSDYDNIIRPFTHYTYKITHEYKDIKRNDVNKFFVELNLYNFTGEITGFAYETDGWQYNDILFLDNYYITTLTYDITNYMADVDPYTYSDTLIDDILSRILNKTIDTRGYPIDLSGIPSAEKTRRANDFRRATKELYPATRAYSGKKTVPLSVDRMFDSAVTITKEYYPSAGSGNHIESDEPGWLASISNNSPVPTDSLYIDDKTTANLQCIRNNKTITDDFPVLSIGMKLPGSLNDVIVPDNFTTYRNDIGPYTFPARYLTGIDDVDDRLSEEIPLEINRYRNRSFITDPFTFNENASIKIDATEEIEQADDPNKFPEFSLFGKNTYISDTGNDYGAKSDFLQSGFNSNSSIMENVIRFFEYRATGDIISNYNFWTGGAKVFSTGPIKRTRGAIYKTSSTFNYALYGINNSSDGALEIITRSPINLIFIEGNSAATTFNTVDSFDITLTYKNTDINQRKTVFEVEDSGNYLRTPNTETISTDVISWENYLGDNLLEEVDTENCTFASLNGVMYISNGLDNIKKYDGKYVYNAGVPNAGSFKAQDLDRTKTYAYLFEYTDWKGNVVSGEPKFCEETTTVPGASHEIFDGYDVYSTFDDAWQEENNIPLTVNQPDNFNITKLTDERRMRVKIYKKLSAYGSHYLSLDLPINDEDKTIAELNQLYTSSYASEEDANSAYEPDAKRHDPPPKGKYITAYKNCLVVAGQYDNKNNVQYSLPFSTSTLEIGSEYFPAADNGIVVESKEGDSITALYPFKDNLYVFHKNAISIFSGDIGTLETPSVRAISQESGVGAVSNSAIQELMGMLVFLSSKGLYSISNTTNVDKFSEPVDNLFLNTRLTNRQLNRSISFIWEEKEVMMLVVPEFNFDENTSKYYINKDNTLILAYDYSKQAWLRWDTLEFVAGIANFAGEINFIRTNESNLFSRCNISNDNLPSDYSDDGEPIKFYYESNWESMGASSVPKKFLRLLMHFMDVDKDFENNGFSLNVGICRDYTNTEVSNFTIDVENVFNVGWGQFTWGVIGWGGSWGGNVNNIFIKNKLPNFKAKSLKLVFKNDDNNQNIFINNWEYEVAVTYRQEIKD